MSAVEPIDAVSEFASRLWQGLAGWACMCFGREPYISERGKYEFGVWDQAFHRWPGERVRLYRQAVDEAAEADVYVAVALRTKRRRTADTAAPSRYLWADVDGVWTAERQRQFDGVAGPGSFLVASGTGGRHAYLRLEKLVPPTRYVELNQRFALALDGDAKHDAAVVLRVPGTLNHKPPTFGTGSAIPVRMVHLVGGGHHG